MARFEKTAPGNAPGVAPPPSTPVAPRYRAKLTDPGDIHAERPVMIYGNDWREIEKWAETALSRAISPDAIVEAFETLEQRIAVYTKKP